MSFPSRGMWIEIAYICNCIALHIVIPLAGNVDWNLCQYGERRWMMEVIPLAGNVDWNSHTITFPLLFLGHSPRGECGLKSMVKERISSQHGHSPRGECGLKSPTDNTKISRPTSFPSRGMWIEIRETFFTVLKLMSFPSRGMWIEIGYQVENESSYDVIPLAGNVDWNCGYCI